MNKRASLTVGLALASLTAFGVAQERTKDKKPPTFQELHAAVRTHYDAGSFGKALKASREMMGLIAVERSKKIVAALPAAPAGYTAVPQKKAVEAANPFAGGLAATVGNVIQQQYRGDNGQLDVTVTADSPMISMVSMMFDNPALIGPDAELIKYEQCNAILKKNGQRWNLQILIGSALIEANFGKEDDEFALKMFDQAAVTKLTKALEN